MKNKFKIISSLLALTVLFAILFQSVHSFEHLSEQINAKKCYHKPTSGTHLTHEHKQIKHCFVCDFSFSNFISSKISFFNLTKPSKIVSRSFYFTNQVCSFFKGSLFQLRAPPIL